MSDNMEWWKELGNRWMQQEIILSMAQSRLMTKKIKEAVRKQKEFPKLAEFRSAFGVDIDTLDVDTYQATLQKCEQFGHVIDRRSKHGWHFKVYLNREVALWHTFKMRYYCGDDYHRLARDMMKAIEGRRIIDVLFDVKDIKRESILSLRQSRNGVEPKVLTTKKKRVKPNENKN